MINYKVTSVATYLGCGGVVNTKKKCIKPRTPTEGPKRTLAASSQHADVAAAGEVQTDGQTPG